MARGSPPPLPEDPADLPIKPKHDEVLAMNVADPIPVSYTHLTLPTNREV